MESARFKECFVTKSRSKSAFLIYEYFIHSGCLLLLLLLLLLLFIYLFLYRHISCYESQYPFGMS